MNTKKCLIALALLLSFGAKLHADEAFFSPSFKDLNAQEIGPKEPASAQTPRQRMSIGNRAEFDGYIVLDGEGEAYFANHDMTQTAPEQWSPANAQVAIVIRAPQNKDVTGTLFLPKDSSNQLTKLKFKVSAQLANEKAKTIFLTQKESHYRRLSSLGVAGGAWFRHVADETAKQLQGNVPNATQPVPNVRWNRNVESIDDLSDFFSGGRAVSENLQLDRVLPNRPATQPAAELVDVNSITGITVREMDWNQKLAGAKPKLDSLASLIPVDQHVLFFPSFSAICDIADEAQNQTAPLQNIVLPSAQDSQILKRYEKQLGLSLSGLGRLLGPKVIRSVAVTGSDPNLLTGTDVAVLFDAVNPAALKALLATQITMQSQLSNPKAAVVGGKLSNVEFAIASNADRSFCSLIAVIDSTVIVTNSQAQLQRLIDVKDGRSAAITTAPEYQFFRSRYALEDADELVLLVLTDATIRRWCGPRYRIGSVRRTLALAALTEIQAQKLDDLQHQRADAPLKNKSHFELGTLTAFSNDVSSSIFGTTAFMTPISELDLNQVTRDEANMYERWRDTYQQNWQQFFDPIALKISRHGQTIAADLTVAPLIAATQYREMIELTKGAKIAPTAGDPHDDLLHVIMAINAKSRTALQAGNFISNTAQGLKMDPLGWLGQSIAVYIDDDPIWKELAEKKIEERNRFIESKFYHLPIALHFEVTDAFRLTAFLVGIRGFIEQSSPGLTNWETVKYNEQAYVKVSQNQPPANAQAVKPEERALYYAATNSALILTLNEDLLKRALDRQVAAKPATQPAAQKIEPNPWPGESLCASINQAGINLLESFNRDMHQTSMQHEAWKNIPILNEWKRRFPTEDPVVLHEKYWKTKLISPDGGAYVWNEQWQTMESSTFGNPAEPKAGPALPASLSTLDHATAGITFEEQGLRAHAELDRHPQAEK